MHLHRYYSSQNFGQNDETTNLPSYRIQLCNRLGHIFIFIIRIRNSVDFECHVIFYTPITNAS
jgi:hypothetical protein